MKYISATAAPSGCIFCEAARAKNDRKRFVIERNGSCFSLLNLFPYNNGHIMVAPYKHTGELSGLDRDTVCDMFELIAASQRALEKGFRPEGFNIGINVGRAGGAGIVDHVHVHVVPRWNGDTNFMPVIGETKIVSQGLEAAYDALLNAMKQKS